MSNPLVIYHGGCRDGRAAAWCLWRRYPNAEFVGGVYGTPPPDVIGRDVIIVDFSYSRDVMEQIARDCASLLVLDHHKTAQAALTMLEVPSDKSVVVCFDMERSGAGMAWDYFFPGQPRPWLIDYVEDRDLWRHKLPNGPAVNAYISTLPYDFEVWDRESRGYLDKAVEYGYIVENKIRQYVAETAKSARRVVFEGHEVPCVNAPITDISELVGFLSGGEVFAIGWHQGKDAVFRYSLRSRGDFDVSELAKKYGGGGHENSAGFSADRLLF